MRIIIHIGTPKTGSTSLQNMLRHNRETLAQSGVLYPQISAAAHHNPLALCHYQPGSHDDGQTAWQTVTAQAHKAQPHTVILSTETFIRISDFDGLRENLRQISPTADIEVVCYLRHPVRLHESKISQRMGRTAKLRLPKQQYWTTRLAPWRDTGNLHLHAFDLAEGGRIDVRTHFTETYLADISAQIDIPEQQKNTSLSAEGAIVLQTLMRAQGIEDGAAFKTTSNMLRARITDAEHALRGRVCLHPIRVTTPVAWQVLDAAYEDMVGLERDFGFRFADAAIYDQAAMQAGLRAADDTQLARTEDDALLPLVTADAQSALQIMAHVTAQGAIHAAPDPLKHVKTGLRKLTRRAGR